MARRCALPDRGDGQALALLEDHEDLAERARAAMTRLPAVCLG